MTEKYVSVYPVSFGTRVFMHRNGVIYQAEYRGIKVTEDGICGHNVNTQHIFWLGNKQGEIEVASNISIYTTVQDATQERNAIALNKINIENFSKKYLLHLLWNGIQFSGWLWDGSRPICRTPRERLKGCVIHQGEIEFIDCQGNVYDANKFNRFYQTAEECRENNTPKIVMLDDEDDEEFAERKRDEFYEYVAHHCPGFENEIDWEYFYNLRPMSENLAEQVRAWTNRLD